MLTERTPRKVKIVMLPLRDIKLSGFLTGDDVRHALKNIPQIKLEGLCYPILADKDLTIIAGHPRLLAAHMLNVETVPVAILEDYSPNQIEVIRNAGMPSEPGREWLTALVIQLSEYAEAAQAKSLLKIMRGEFNMGHGL